MPDYGLDLGFDLSMLNFMTYTKYKNHSFGFYMVPRTYFTSTLSKNILQSVFEELDLTEKVSGSFNTVLMQYLDFNFILSTRAKFIEKVVPVKAIYAGIAFHVYFPTVYAKVQTSADLTKGIPDSGVINNYDLKLKGDATFGTNKLFSVIFSYISPINTYAGDYLNYGGSAAFGLGLDL
jgi:hypothetical protein